MTRNVMNIPEVKIVEATAGAGLDGFEELDRWAHHNEPLWQMLNEKAWQIGLREEDRVKLLAVEFLKIATSLKEERIRREREGRISAAPVPFEMVQIQPPAPAVLKMMEHFKILKVPDDVLPSGVIGIAVSPPADPNEFDPAKHALVLSK